MPGPMPEYGEPLRLAKLGETLAGTVEIGTMPRLIEILASPQGQVGVSLEFWTDEGGQARVDGDFDASVLMICQRCLQPLRIRQSGRISLRLISGFDTQVDLSETVEPFFVEPGVPIRMAELIEDEMLLSLPPYPSHPPVLCPAHTPSYPTPHERRSPFAVLATLKRNH